MKKNETYGATCILTLENSFGVLKKQDVKIDVTLAIKDDEYGFFEFFDTETGGDEWYAEGGIWFEGTKVTDYDGVFSLPPFITKKLQEWGFDTSEVE